jgi:hypothetical protein
MLEDALDLLQASLWSTNQISFPVLICIFWTKLAIFTVWNLWTVSEPVVVAHRVHWFCQIDVLANTLFFSSIPVISMKTRKRGPTTKCNSKRLKYLWRIIRIDRDRPISNQCGFSNETMPGNKTKKCSVLNGSADDLYGTCPPPCLLGWALADYCQSERRWSTASATLLPKNLNAAMQAIDYRYEGRNKGGEMGGDIIDYRWNDRHFWLSAHDCQVPTPRSQNLDLEQQIRIFEAD